MLPRIRMVTFDALYTLVVPRLPIHIQYSQTFEPYLGVLDPMTLKQSFGDEPLTLLAFQSLEKEQPVYSRGSQTWWAEVIRRTALGAGADEKALHASLSQIIPRLLRRFSSKEGYRAFDDAIPTVRSLHYAMGIRTAIVSNADSRIRLVLQDLGFPSTLDPIVLSEDCGIEKPDPGLFLRALSISGAKQAGAAITPEECLHIGDEFDTDYKGALAAGMQAILLRRPGADGERAHKDSQGPLPQGVRVVEDLHAVKLWIQSYNSRS